MITPRTAFAAGSLSALLLVCGSATAQTALGDGRALERNPQVGYGGANAAAHVLWRTGVTRLAFLGDEIEIGVAIGASC